MQHAASRPWPMCPMWEPQPSPLQAQVCSLHPLDLQTSLRRRSTSQPHSGSVLCSHGTMSLSPNRSCLSSNDTHGTHRCLYPSLSVFKFHKSGKHVYFLNSSSPHSEQHNAKQWAFHKHLLDGTIGPACSHLSTRPFLSPTPGLGIGV